MSNLIHISSQNVKNLWEQLNRTLIEYESVTKNKKKQYEYLKEQDSVHQQCILQYPKVQLHLQNATENLRCNIQILSLKRDEQVGNLKMKNARIKKETRDMKQYFGTVQAVDYVQLKKLTVFSNDALKVKQYILSFATYHTIHNMNIIILFLELAKNHAEMFDCSWINYNML